MKPISEYATVCPGVFVWQGYEPAVKCDCSCSAVVTSAGLIFIDPLPLAEEVLQELVAESFSAPAAVVLTSGNHQRESREYAKRFGIPVFAPEEAGEDFVADQRFLPRDLVAGMESISLPGFGPGETAFLYEGTLIFGDALLHLDPQGLRLLPEKYCTDKKLSRRSLAVLENFFPKILLFAHGNPIVQRATVRLAAALAG